MKRASETLLEGAETYQSRNAVYGDAHHMHGKIMQAIFQNGLELNTEQDFARFGVINMIVSKLSRYSYNFHNNGHADSIYDLMVYAAMLSELDGKGENAKENPVL